MESTAQPEPKPRAVPPLARERRPAEEKPAPPRRRRWWLLGLGGGVLALVGLVYFLYSRRFETTDDAQIDANISNVGARVGGTITRVHVAENQAVRVGDVLAEIDPADLQVALAQARATVAQAEAQLAAEDPSVLITETTNATALSNASANISSAAAGLSGAEREIEQAAARLAEAQAQKHNADLELARGVELVTHDAIPRAELDRRQSAAAAASAVVDGARQALEAARARAAQQRALISGVRSNLTEVRKNAPLQMNARRATVLSRRANLELARAQERQAELNLQYAQVRTPVAGIVARKAVNVGDGVVAGQPLAAIAQTGDVWVTANFRETQLGRMRPGQRAQIHVDAIDRDFVGTVESLGGATGSRVSVLPPENATGNYVKVVQRIPVRIRFDPGQRDLERLRPGMSVEPKVRVSG